MNCRPHYLPALLIPVVLGLATLGPGDPIHRSTAPDDLARTKKPAPEKPWRPAYSELEFMLFDPPIGAPEPMPNYLLNPQYAFPTQQKTIPISMVRGEKIYDLKNPPMQRHWWKVPTYIVAGLPRDTIDMFFGAASYVPLMNLPITGAYELSGAQYLMRHPSDYHEYGGGANERGHGWNGGTSWGWFSNAHRTTFKEVDQGRLAGMKSHNEAVDMALESKNQDILKRNRQVDQAAKAYLQSGREALDAGRFEEAVARFWNHVLNRPNDAEGQAYYVVSLIAQPEGGDANSAWRQREIRRILNSWPSGQYPLLLSTLGDYSTRHPENPAVRYWLAALYGYFGAATDSLSEARRLAADPNSGARENGLLFELALHRWERSDPATASNDAPALLKDMEEASARLLQKAPNTPEAGYARARLLVMKGDYASGIREAEALAAAHPKSPRLLYGAGISHLLQGMFGSDFDAAAATAWLEKSQAFTGLPPRRQAAISDALAHVAGIEPKKRVRAPAVAE